MGSDDVRSPFDNPGLLSRRLGLGILLLSYLALIPSALRQVDLSWQSYLVSARVTLAMVALALMFVRPFTSNVVSKFTLLCMAAQASFSFLEGRERFDFFEYIPYYFFVSCLFYEGTMSKWAKRYLPTLVIATALPLLVKNVGSLGSVGDFVYKFTTPVALAFLSAAVVMSRAGRFEALLENLRLKAQLLDLERLRRGAAEEELALAREQSRKDASAVAIASTTQALAHDIRKPFSMFKSIIQIVEGTEDPEEVREVLKVTLPEVNQAMASVEGMIQDVMQIGADAKLILEDAAPETLVEAALGDLFRVYPNADVSLEYAFTHRNMVQADSVRLGRVFANILGNAVQAMREKGSLWIRTVERAGFVEFTLGNAGSVIPAESLPKLFDAFFTSGKKGGTGLGLAIAKKIVEAHGGTIFCRSEKNDTYPKGMVEFVFTLPASHAACSPRSDALPPSSREIQAAFAAVRIAAQRQAGAGPDPREVEIEAHLVARLDALRAPEAGLATACVTVLVVDDEAVYRNGLLALLERSEALAQRVRMVFARNEVEAFAAVKEHAPVLLIEDVDLGPNSKDGLEIVRRLRETGFEGHICVHSNRFLAGDSRAALVAGADAVLPKPMGRVHLLKLILASLPEPQAAAAAVEHAPTAPPRKLNVAMLDDSLSMRLAWKMELGAETNFRAFASTTAFFETCERELGYFASLDVVVTDYNFAPGDPHDGGTFARELRVRDYEGLVLRASGETDLGHDIEMLFDGDVGKAALEWPDFERAVEAARSAKVGRLSRG